MNKETMMNAIDMMKAVYVKIASAGAMGKPSGHLYAEIMEYVDLNAYQSMIRLMINKGLLSQRGDLLFITE
jgi:hypothetical protein